MDCASFFTERVNHFDEERKLIARYKSLVTPVKSEMHQLSWDTSQQHEAGEQAAREVQKVIDETDLAHKELEFKREELADMREAQIARKSQLVRLSQLAQPIESDVTYLFNEKDRHSGKRNVIESAPSENQVAPANALKQTKTGDLIQLENKVQEITKLVVAKFSDFDVEFVNANVVSHRCEQEVMDKVKRAISEARVLIDEMNSINQQAFFSVHELLHLRLKIMVAQRMEVEELESLTKEKQYFLLKERELRDQLVAEMAQMKSRLKYELAGSTKELHRQLEDIKVRRDRLNTARVQELQLQEEAKRPGSIAKKKRPTRMSANSNSNSNSNKNNNRGQHGEGVVDHEWIQLEKKQLEKEDLEKQLAHIKGRHERQKQHYKLAMEGYRTEMRQMHAQISQMRKAMAAGHA